MRLATSCEQKVTNLAIFDDVFLDRLCNEYLFPDGSQPNKETVKLLQKMYVDLHNETLRITPFTFPVVTACFAVDDDRNIIDKDFLNFVAENNLEFGFMNIYAGKTSTLSSCCRLRSDTDKMYVNSFGSGGTKIGSCSVTTLNLPRISYTVNNKEEFIDTLKKRVELIAKINYVKRYIVDKRIKSGNLPLYTLGFMELDRQYLTCGINGVNEAVEILGYDVLTKEGQKFVEEILTTVNDVNSKMEKEFGEGIMLNCEQTPSENSAIKLATADRILGYNDKYDLYSNQFIPLITKADLLDRVKLQGMFDNLMTGGAICHLNVDTEIKDKQLIIDLINMAVKMGVVYHAINYNIQECSKGHISVGKGDTCHCGAKIVNNYTRTVG